ncbi:phage gp6-like head-tail connector protein [Streptomyces ginkgonis]|uniref:phage gp6-like head-tail connector protein n=1 Tax=Streptomyces ginkgonis TaxID=1812259 RepID=UPI0021769E57|nr:phage gp6-like head-tail connector protein [Streptomyces ginkgonis]
MEARLGRPLTQNDKYRVNAYIVDASALVEDYCGRDFTFHREEAFLLSPVADRQLPVPPRYLPNLTVSSVAFDASEPLKDWVLSGQSLWRAAGWHHGQAVRVTGTWGYEVPPAAVTATVCAEVIRWLAVAPGLASERVGDVEVQFGSPATGQTLSPAARSSLSRYRRKATSVALRRPDGPLYLGGGA